MEGAGREQTVSSEGTKREIVEDFELARQKALEVAARLNTAAESKRPRLESPDGASANSAVSNLSYPAFTAQTAQYNGLQGTSKNIHIPNGKVGVIIGRGGDMIKNLQHRSGARIQITRDSDADPTSLTRDVELMGTPEQISRADELINEVIAETDAAGSGGGPSGNHIINPVHCGGEQFVMKVPNDKVALIIGKGGEAIKSMQSKSGAHIQVVPLHPLPGDTSTERSVYISGTAEQIDSAKELVNDVMCWNRLRTYSGSTGYAQAAYSSSGGWAPQGQPPIRQQQAGYGYSQHGHYAVPPHYYGRYPTQQPTWDQTNPSTVPAQPQQTTAYNMYGQQQQQPAQPTSALPNASYGYSQAPPPSFAYDYNQGGYPQQLPAYGQDTSTQLAPTGTKQQKPYANLPNPVYGQQSPASSQPDIAGRAQTSHLEYGAPPGTTTAAHLDAGTSQSQPLPTYGTGYSQPATTTPVNGYGSYPGYGALPSFHNQAGYTQMAGYPPGPRPASYPYYRQSGYPPQQANYNQGTYPSGPGQPTSTALQPPTYGVAKPNDGNSVAGSAATAVQEAES